MVTFGAPMTAPEPSEQSRRARRRRMTKVLALGGAAVGIPALVNLLIARSTQRMKQASWGDPSRYSWRFGEISFQKLGEGEPIVLLHSLGPGHDGSEWRTAAELLAQSYRVYVPDLLGWGRSQRPSLVYDDSLYIRFLSDFIDDVVGQPAILFAAGVTAPYAARVALDEPNKVDMLGLVHPPAVEGVAPEPDLKDALLRKLLRTPILGTSALNLYTSRRAIENHLREVVSARPELVAASDTERFYTSAHQEGAHAALASYLSGFLNHQIGEDVARLQQPLWLSWGRGAQDESVRLQLESWLKAQPAAEIDVYDGVGMLPHWELADEFGQRAVRFLTQAATVAG